MYETLREGGGLPINIEGQAIYYMGPSPAREGRPIGSAGPTTASRMDKYTPELLDLGMGAMIGKGKRSQEVIDAVVRNKAVYFAAVGGAGALLLIAGKFVPYVHKRIVSWRDPFADTSAAGYQIVQSLYSIGSGGFLGLGLGQSRQKYLYLPEEHNDYIFSIVCEELGYVGAIAILILFALLICRGYWIAAHSPDRYSFLVGVGITTLLSIQVFLNIAVVTNLIPCTGISLPFFSYGGTALLMQLGEMGIILSISRDIPTKKAR